MIQSHKLKARLRVSTNSNIKTSKRRQEKDSKATRISLTSIASVASYDTMVQRLPANTAENIIMTIWQV